MFAALGRLASRRPWFVIVAWIIFAGLVIALAPAFKATQDQAEFLPGHYESIKAFNLQDEAFPQNSQVAAIVLSDDVTGFDQPSFDAVKALRANLEKSVTGDLQYGVTGNVAQSYDQQESGNKALLIVGLATVVLIVLLLALIFRSVLICLMPIIVVAIVSQIALGLIATANKLFDLKASQDIETILIVVLYGIGTDYILFFLFRY